MRRVGGLHINVTNEHRIFLCGGVGDWGCEKVVIFFWGGGGGFKGNVTLVTKEDMQHSLSTTIDTIAKLACLTDVAPSGSQFFIFKVI